MFDMVFSPELMAGLIRKLIGIACAIVIMFAFSAHLDRRGGIDFKADVWPVLLKDPRALGLYVGMRVLAISIITGLGFAL